MSGYATRMNAGTLLSVLERTGHITPQSGALIGDYIIEKNRDDELPIYQRILIGVGAALSSGFLLAFFALTKVIDFRSAGEMMFWGVIFTLNAVLLLRRAEQKGPVGNSFLTQTSFCSIGVGKILFVMGIAELVDGRNEMWAAMFGTLIISAATWHFYKMTLDRFLSALAVLLMLLGNIMTDYTLGEPRALLLNAYGLALLVAAAGLFMNPKVTREFMPLGYAVLAALGVIAGMFAMHLKLGWGHRAIELDPVFMNIGFAAALIGLIGWAADDMKALAKAPLNIAALGVAVLGAVSAPGVIFATGLMILGYARQEKLLTMAGGAAMPFFLWAYYYNMDVTLMEKSGVLVLSGAVLLAGKLYISARNIGREEKA